MITCHCSIASEFWGESIWCEMSCMDLVGFASYRRSDAYWWEEVESFKDRGPAKGPCLFFGRRHHRWFFWRLIIRQMLLFILSCWGFCIFLSVCFLPHAGLNCSTATDLNYFCYCTVAESSSPLQAEHVCVIPSPPSSCALRCGSWVPSRGNSFVGHNITNTLSSAVSSCVSSPKVVHSGEISAVKPHYTCKWYRYKRSAELSGE